MRRHVTTASSGSATPSIGTGRGRFVAGLLAAATLTVGIVAVLSAGAAPAATKVTGTLRLVVEVNRFADARDDLDPAGDSPGDQVFNDDAVLDVDNRRAVGRVMTVTSFQQGGRALQTGALRLRDGTITLAGVLVDGAPEIAVTGGTKAYAGVRGTYRVSAKPIAPIVGDRPGRYRATIVFVP